MPHQPTASNGGEGLRLALEQCRDQFRFYEREHMAAGKVDKASTNRTFADLADAAIAPPVPRSEIEAAYWEATAHLDAPAAMTPEQRRLEDLKQMAAYAGPVVSLTVTEPYYLASCDGCGWVGSSEACGTDHMGDDSDVFCPRCQRPGCDHGAVANAIGSDLVETIQNADDAWQAKGYPTALAEVRDMANVGRSLLERIADNAACPPLKGWHPADCPTEVVTDLLNMLDEAKTGGVVVRFDERGEINYLVAGSARLLIVDERAPQDRVYEYESRVEPDEITALLGAGPVGNQRDDRHPAVEARITASMEGRPHLRSVKDEG